MLRRHRSLATMTMVIAAFAIAAMHIGMADHPMSMALTDMSMSAAAHDAAPMAALTSTSEHMQPVSVAMSGQAPTRERGHQGSSVMTITMMCHVLVLVTAAGSVLRHLVARRSNHAPALAPSAPVLEHPHRGLRPARPPGLSMLCVAIC